MSQFMLVVDKPQNLDKIFGLQVLHITEADEFLKLAAQELLSASELESCWYVQNEADKTTDTLFTEAQQDLAEGTHFRATRLGRLLQQLLITSRKVILWYGNDWYSLPSINDEKEFMATVESQLVEDRGEVYLRFQRVK